MLLDCSVLAVCFAIRAIYIASSHFVLGATAWYDTRKQLPPGVTSGDGSTLEVLFNAHYELASTTTSVLLSSSTIFSDGLASHGPRPRGTSNLFLAAFSATTHSPLLAPIENWRGC